MHAIIKGNVKVEEALAKLNEVVEKAQSRNAVSREDKGLFSEVPEGPTENINEVITV